MPGVIRLPELKPIREQKAEKIFVTRHIAKPIVVSRFVISRYTII